MGTQVELRSRRVRLGATVVVAAVSLSFAVAASAASLNVASADIFSMSDGAAVDLPLAFAEFDVCRADLDGDTDVVGNTWEAPSGIWRCQVNYSRATTNDLDFAADSAVINVGQSDHLTVSASLIRTSRTASGAGSGLSLFHNGGAHHMYVVYQRGSDRIVLGKLDGSGDTDLATFAWPNAAEIGLRVVIDKPNITVYADGSPVINYTMTPAILATFGSNTRFGMEADLDRRGWWDWFRVDDDS
jgi:hypothetical protein